MAGWGIAPASPTSEDLQDELEINQEQQQEYDGREAMAVEATGLAMDEDDDDYQEPSDSEDDDAIEKGVEQHMQQWHGQQSQTAAAAGFAAGAAARTASAGAGSSRLAQEELSLIHISEPTRPY